jgi:hypothetical protein
MLLTYDDLLAQPEATANALAQFALGHDADPTSLAAAAALPRPQSRRSTIDSQSLIRDPRVPSEIALRYFELRSSGSIDSRASNPITTQPSAALLNSRHGS